MFKYTLSINGEDYKALFGSHGEAGCFIIDCVDDGDYVEVVDVCEYSAYKALDDTDFSYAYRIEVVASFLFGTVFDTVTDCEKKLIAEGWL